MFIFLALLLPSALLSLLLLTFGTPSLTLLNLVYFFYCLSFVLRTIPLSFKYLISLQNIHVTTTYYYNLLLLILTTVLLSIFLLKKLHAVRNRPCLSVYELRQATHRLGCVAGFHSGHHLICCKDRTVILKSSLLWAAWSTLDSVLLATVIKVSVSHL